MSLPEEQGKFDMAPALGQHFPVPGQSVKGMLLPYIYPSMHFPLILVCAVACVCGWTLVALSSFLPFASLVRWTWAGLDLP